MAPVTLLVPAYQYPTVDGFWPGLEANSPPVKYLVANPSSGPGASPNSDYVTAINAAQAAGITVLGYINTADGTVPVSTAVTQAGQWASFYGVTSLFYDNAATSPAFLPYYSQLCTVAHATSGAIAVLNHGAIPDPGYASIGDVLLVYESPQSAWSAFTPPAWFALYPASKFAVLVYDIPDQGTMTTIMGQVQSFGVGQAYLTDETGANPYDTLPAWWAAEVSLSLATFGSGNAVTATYHGTQVRGYLQYADASTGQTLVARPAATYTIRAEVTGQANPPGDGMWTVAGS